MKSINEVIQSPSAGLWIRVDDTAVAKLYTSYPDTWLLTSDAEVELDQPAYQNLFVRCKPHLVNVPRRLPTLPKPIQDMYKRQGVKGTLAVPIMRGEQAIGFLTVRRQDRATFTDSEVEVAVALADIAALALELKRLADEGRGAAILTERTRFAREIHDTLAQEFTGVMLHASAAKQSMIQGYPGAAAEHLEKVRSLAMEGLTEARRSVYALRSSVLDNADLGMALRSLAERIRIPEMAVNSKVTGNSYPIDPEIEANLLRIAQEALGNAARHSQASRIDIRLDYSASRVKLTVKDNGAGFDPQTAKGKGFGLESMAERALSQGMKIKIETEIGKGVTITVRAPRAIAKD